MRFTVKSCLNYIHYQAMVLSTCPSLFSWQSPVSSPSPVGSPPSSGPTSYRHQPLVFLTKMAKSLMYQLHSISTFSPSWYFCCQTILMIIGALVLSILAFTHEDIGGYEQLVRFIEKNLDEKKIQSIGLSGSCNILRILTNKVDKFFTATASTRANATLDGLEKCGEVLLPPPPPSSPPQPLL